MASIAKPSPDTAPATPEAEAPKVKPAKPASAVETLKQQIADYTDANLAISHATSTREASQNAFKAFLADPGSEAHKTLFAARAAHIAEQGGGVHWADEMRGALHDLAVHQVAG